MERRNRSLEALDSLIYLDSLDDELRAKALKNWMEQYLQDKDVEDFDLSLQNLKIMSELFYKNINFLKTFNEQLGLKINSSSKIKKFLN